MTIYILSFLPFQQVSSFLIIPLPQKVTSYQSPTDVLHIYNTFLTHHPQIPTPLVQNLSSFSQELLQELNQVQHNYQTSFSPLYFQLQSTKKLWGLVIATGFSRASTSFLIPFAPTNNTINSLCQPVLDQNASEMPQVTNAVLQHE